MCSRDPVAHRHATPRDTHAVVREVIDALIDALSESMDYDIALSIARFHGPMCSAASDACAGHVVRFDGTNMMCDVHLRKCIQCGVEACPSCLEDAPPMIHLSASGAPAFMWICQRHIVPCSPVCVPDLGWETCTMCHRGACFFHIMEAALRDRTGNIGVCNECSRRCSACKMPLHRQTVRGGYDTESPSFKAGMCIGCYERACGEQAWAQFQSIHSLKRLRE